MSSTSTISGSTLETESRRGVHGAQVVSYDRAPTFEDLERVIDAPPEGFGLDRLRSRIPGQRMRAVSTHSGGAFSFAFAATLTVLLLAVGCGGEPPPEVGEITSASTLASPIYLRPTADTTVVSSHPTTNYGRDPTLQVDAQDSEGGVEQTYLKFEVGSVAGRIGRARLRLEVLGASTQTADIYRISDASWSEHAVTWMNKPFVPGTAVPIASIGRTSVGEVVYRDVTGAVAPNSKFTFAILPGSTDNADFASKEHPTARRPSLILDRFMSCNPPNATPNVAACSVDSTMTAGRDVSGAMALNSQVTVRQLTNGANGEWNMITYYDIPAVIAGSNRFVYSRVGTEADDFAGTMKLDGTDARAFTDSHEAGNNVFVTPTGAMAYFPRNSAGDTMQIRAVDLDGSTCGESTIVSNLPRPTGGAQTQLSIASRSCPIDKWVIAVATDEMIHRFKGKAAASGLWAPMGSFTLQDDLKAQPFHRIRLSPTCPNIVMYSRNREDGPGDKDIYLADLDRQPHEPYFLSFGQKAKPITGFRWAPSHEMWSHDGLRVSYTQSTPAGYEPRKLMVSNILNSDCTFRTVNPDGTSNLRIGEGGGDPGKEAIARRTFKGTVIQQTGGARNWVPKFCSWSADDELFACSGYLLPAEILHAIYLLNPASGATRLLALTSEDTDVESPYHGQSHLQFAGDKTTILFDSDRLEGTNRLPGQVYKITYPSSLIPE